VFDNSTHPVVLFLSMKKGIYFPYTPRRRRTHEWFESERPDDHARGAAPGRRRWLRRHRHPWLGIVLAAHVCLTDLVAASQRLLHPINTLGGGN
jgi:hypothetical protein